VPAPEEHPVKNCMMDLVKSSKKEHPLAIAATGKSAIDKPATDKLGVINTHNSDAPAAEIKSSPTKNEDSKGKSVDKRELLYKCMLPLRSLKGFGEDIGPHLASRAILKGEVSSFL
jgi:hypothetical protein